MKKSNLIRYKESLSDINESLKLGNGNLQTFLLAFKCFQNLGIKEKALYYINEALKIDKNITLYEKRCSLLYEMKKYEESLLDSDKVLLI